MKAMILAAGRGERLRPITDTIPKPLVKVGDITLLEWHIKKLKKAGITDILINSAYLHDKIVSYIGDGSLYGVKVTHSVEGDSGLETAGGIINALPFFGKDEFLVVNGDTFVDADYKDLLRPLKDGKVCQLYLTDNPPHNLKGDFSLDESGSCFRGEGYTFSGAAIYRPEAFMGMAVEKKPLLPLFIEWSEKNLMTGSKLDGRWFDVGTIERLNDVNDYVSTHELKGI